MKPQAYCLRFFYYQSGYLLYLYTMKKILILLLVLIAGNSVQAQKVIWGYVKDSITNEPIEMASITNTNKNNTVITNQKGLFKIEVSKNDILSVAAIGYHFDTVLYSGIISASDTVTFYLKPISRELNDVTVQNTGANEYSLDSLRRLREFTDQMVSPPVKSVELANSGAGFGISLNSLSKREKNKRNAIKIFNASEKQAYVDYRFSTAIVSKYSGLKGEELQVFMQRYRPSYEWLRKNPKEEDIKYYINEKLKERRK